MKLLPVLMLWICIVVCEARIKEPGWKHCVVPLHALPGEWGRVTSPGFPNGINKQIQCSWVITSNPGFRIKLAFQTLNMTGSMKSCFTQFVEILDYKIGNSVGKFCGARRPGDYVSYGSKLRFDLQGDTSGQKTKGFEIRFRATKENGGFKSTWAFTSTKSKGKSKGNNKKKKKKSGPPKNPKSLGPPLVSKPGGSRPGGNRGGPPRRPAPTEESEEGPTEEPAKPATKAPPPRTPPAQLPPRRVPQPAKRILPQPAPPGGGNRPVYYGANNNVRGIDHGASRVISSSDEEPEQEFDLYLIIGIAAGGLVALIIIFVMMKICICDKNKKLREEKAKAAMNQNNPNPDHFHMSTLPGSVPEQFMSEQIMPPLQSYPYMHPAHLSSVSHHPHHNPQFGTLQPLKKSHRGSTRSRSRNARSRSTRSHSEIRKSTNHRSKSRGSVRASRSRASIRKAKSKSLQHLPHNEGQWVMVDPRHMTVPRGMAFLPYSESESRDSSTSSSDWDTESSSDYDVTEKDYRRHKKHNTIPAQPPPYSFNLEKQSYYGKREYDEGYDTGRRTYGTKSRSNKKKEGKRSKRREKEREEKKKKQKRRRKHSY